MSVYEDDDEFLATQSAVFDQSVDRLLRDDQDSCVIIDVQKHVVPTHSVRELTEFVETDTPGPSKHISQGVGSNIVALQNEIEAAQRLNCTQLGEIKMLRASKVKLEQKVHQYETDKLLLKQQQTNVENEQIKKLKISTSSLQSELSFAIAEKRRLESSIESERKGRAAAETRVNAMSRTHSDNDVIKSRKSTGVKTPTKFPLASTSNTNEFPDGIYSKSAKKINIETQTIEKIMERRNPSFDASKYLCHVDQFQRISVLNEKKKYEKCLKFIDDD